MSYQSASMQRVLAVYEALGEASLEGLPLNALGALGERSQVFRALKNLELAGWIEQTPGGAWRLAPKATRISERWRLAIADAHSTYLAPGS